MFTAGRWKGETYGGEDEVDVLGEIRMEVTRELGW